MTQAGHRQILTLHNITVYEADTVELRTGHKLETYWTLLEAELQPKANKIISIIELWNKSKQNSTTLNEWITKVYNMVGPV